MNELKQVLNEFEKSIQKAGISRRDAMKIMSLLPLLSVATPNKVLAKDGKNAKILIVGGGAGGCSIANFLVKNLDNIKVSIIEPDKFSVKYQPGQTFIGAGIWKKEEILKNSKDFFPKEATWIQDEVAEFNADNNFVITKKNEKIQYDFLILATGLELNYEGIEGLNKDIIGTNSIGSIYFPDGAEKTWTLIQNFIQNSKNKKLRGIFTQPATPIKCGGAPKKIISLTHARFKESDLRDNVELNFYTATSNFFGIKEYNDAVISQFKERKLNYNFKHDLISVDVGKKVATFKANDKSLEIPYDFLHVVPPMRAPMAIRSSEFAYKSGKLASGGWAEVSKETMQHKRYKNVFAIGDVAGVPTSKSGAATREQYKVAGNNLLSLIANEELKLKYDGYTACPLITDIGLVMLAEFDYSKKPAPTLPFLDPAKERWLWWLVKLYLFKPLYFYGMLKARD